PNRRIAVRSGSKAYKVLNGRPPLCVRSSRMWVCLAPLYLGPLGILAAGAVVSITLDGLTKGTNRSWKLSGVNYFPAQGVLIVIPKIRTVTQRPLSWSASALIRSDLQLCVSPSAPRRSWPRNGRECRAYPSGGHDDRSDAVFAFRGESASRVP